MDVLANLKENIELSSGKATGVTFNKSDPAERTLATLYLSVLEYAEAIHVLFTNNCITGTHSVFRSMFEAYADIVNLVQDPEYINRIQATEAKQWARLMEESQKENTTLSEIRKESNFEESFDHYKSKLAKLKSQGFDDLRPWERFKLAGLSEEYGSIYNMLCSQSHNNITALNLRHIEIDDNSNFELLHKKQSHDGTHDHVITTTTNLLLISGILIHERFKSNRLKNLTRQHKRFLELEKEHFRSRQSS